MESSVEVADTPERHVSDIEIALHPRREYARVANRVNLNDDLLKNTSVVGKAKTLSHHASPITLSIRRPIFIAFALACAATIMSSAPLDALLVLSLTLSWSFVAGAELIAITLVLPRRQTRSVAQSIDLFFIGHAPWLLLILPLAAVCMNTNSYIAPSLIFNHTVLVALFAFAVILWSAYIDYCFFRVVLQCTRAATIRRLFVQRCVSWTLILGIYVFGGIESEISGRLFS